MLGDYFVSLLEFKEKALGKGQAFVESCDGGWQSFWSNACATLKRWSREQAPELRLRERGADQDLEVIIFNTI
jgi:hypothetical protein